MSFILSRTRSSDQNSRSELDDMMTIMEDAFDPRYGEGWSRAQCDGMLGDANSWLILSRMGERPTGFALSRMIVDEAELLLIGVSPAYREQGIGRELLAEVARTARQRGANRLHLEVRDGNKAANLYCAVGFKRIGRRKDYYSGKDGERFDAITLALQIDRSTL